MAVETPKHSDINTLIDSCDEMLKIDSVHLDKSAREQSSIFFKVQRLLAIEITALEFYEQQRIKAEIYLRRYYEGRLPQTVYASKPLKYPATNKQELEVLLSADEMYSEIKSAVDAAKRRVDFLESVLWRIKERQKEIQSIIEWKKYVEAGI